MHPRYDWSGFYLGAHIGYGATKSDFTDSEYNGAPPFEEVNWRARSEGFLSGLAIGYNIQSEQMLIGVEAEAGFMDFNSRELQPGVDNILGLPYDGNGTISGNTYSGIGVRVGYASRSGLAFIKFGKVHSQLELGFSDNCVDHPCGDTTLNMKQKVGWGTQYTIGGEHAFNEHWSAKGDYSFYDFGKHTLGGTGVGGVGDGDHFNIQSDIYIHTIRVGLNYHF